MIFIQRVILRCLRIVRPCCSGCLWFVSNSALYLLCTIWRPSRNCECILSSTHTSTACLRLSICGSLSSWSRVAMRIQSNGWCGIAWTRYRTNLVFGSDWASGASDPGRGDGRTHWLCRWRLDGISYGKGRPAEDLSMNSLYQRKPLRIAAMDRVDHLEQVDHDLALVEHEYSGSIASNMICLCISSLWYSLRLWLWYCRLLQHWVWWECLVGLRWVALYI